MNLNDLMPIINTLISVLIAFMTAKLTTKRELKKLKSQQNHEIKLNKDKAFADMNRAVNSFNSSPTPKFQREALAAIGGFIPYASEKLLPLCETLETAIKANQHRNASELIIRIREEYSSEQKANKNHKR